MGPWETCTNAAVFKREAWVSLPEKEPMRTIATIPHPEMRITIMAWNGKFLLKCERPYTEQVYKLPETFISEEDVVKLLDESFISSVLTRFEQMETELRDAAAKFG